MKKVRFALILVVISSVLHGCVAAPGLIMMPINMLTGEVINKTVQESRVDKCVTIDIQAQKESVHRIERNRRLTAAGCST